MGASLMDPTKDGKKPGSEATQFKPGNRANPNGRPMGSRNKATVMCGHGTPTWMQIRKELIKMRKISKQTSTSAPPSSKLTTASLAPKLKHGRCANSSTAK